MIKNLYMSLQSKDPTNHNKNTEARDFIRLKSWISSFYQATTYATT